MSLKYFDFNSREALSGAQIDDAKTGICDYMVQADYFGGVEINGLRPAQEDRVSHFQLTPLQAQQLSLMDNQDRDDFLYDLYASINDQLYCKKVEDGSTGVSCLFDPSRKTIHFANLGDSELLQVTINRSNGKINMAKLNHSHGLDNPEEIQRVSGQGYSLFKMPPLEDLRLRSGLNLGRSFADFRSVEYGLSHEPDVKTKQVATSDDVEIFYIVACDGLTEAHRENDLIYKQIAHCVHTHMDRPLHEIAKALSKIAYDADKEYREGEEHSEDNISVLVTKFPKDESALPYMLSVFDGHGGQATSQYIADTFKDNFDFALEEKCGLGIMVPSAGLDLTFAASAASATAIAARKLNFRPLAIASGAMAVGFSSYQLFRRYIENSTEQAQQFVLDSLSEEACSDTIKEAFHAGRQAKQGFLPWLQASLAPSNWGPDSAAFHAGFLHDEDEMGTLTRDFVKKIGLS